MYAVKCWCIFLLRVLWILLPTRSFSFFVSYLNIFSFSGHVMLSRVKFQLSQLGTLHEQFYSQLLLCVLNMLQSWPVMCYCFEKIKHFFTMWFGWPETPVTLILFACSRNTWIFVLLCWSNLEVIVFLVQSETCVNYKNEKMWLFLDRFCVDISQDTISIISWYNCLHIEDYGLCCVLST